MVVAHRLRAHVVCRPKRIGDAASRTHSSTFARRRYSGTRCPACGALVVSATNGAGGHDVCMAKTVLGFLGVADLVRAFRLLADAACGIAKIGRDSRLGQSCRFAGYEWRTDWDINRFTACGGFDVCRTQAQNCRHMRGDPCHSTANRSGNSDCLGAEAFRNCLSGSHGNSFGHAGRLLAVGGGERLAAVF